MQFRIEHRFPGSPTSVAAKMFSPDIGPILSERMSTIIEVEGLAQTREGDLLRARTRYLPVPLIKRVGPKRVEPRWMEWIAEFEFDKTSGKGSFRNIPTTAQVARLMDNHGTIELHAVPGGETLRVLEGELRIKVPLLGRIAEKIIHKNAVSILDDEAEVMRALLAQKPHPG